MPQIKRVRNSVSAVSATIPPAARVALDQGWELSRMLELLTGYLHKQGSDSDEHLKGLIGIVSRAAETFDDAYDAAFREHEKAEDAARPAERAVRQ